MITVSVFWLCIGGFVLIQAGMAIMLFVLGLCNAAAEGERQAEQIREAMRG